VSPVHRAFNLSGVLLPFLGVLLAVLLLWDDLVDWTSLAIMALMYVLTIQGVTLAGGLLAGAAAALAGSPRPVFAAAGVLTLVTVTAAWLAALRHEQVPPGLLVRAGPGPPP